MKTNSQKNIKYILVNQSTDLSNERSITPIEAACRSGNVNILKRLLSKNTNMHIDLHLPQSIICAIQYNHPEMLKPLVSYLKSHAYDLLYSVRYACYLSSLDLIQALLKNGVSIKEIESEALHYCIQTNNFSFADQLIACGFDVHFNDDILFQDGCIYGDTNKLKYLLRKGANLHRDNEAPLRLACDTGLFNIVILLCQEGANLHINKDEPLKLACLAREYFSDSYNKIDEESDTRMNEHFAVVKYLVEKGADIHQDNESMLVAACSSEYAQLEIVKYLIDKGANINLVKNEILPILRKNGKREIYNYILSLTKKPKLH